MTALLVLLLAVASVLNSCVRVGWMLRGLRLAVGLLAAASVLTVLGVLVGWPILHVRGGGVVAVVLMSVAWLCWDLVPQRWWARLPGSRQQSRLGSEGPREDLSHVLPLVRLACTALLFLVVAVCALVSEPLGSRAAKVAAAVGVAVFLTAPAKRVVADILAVARHSSQGSGKIVVTGCEPSQESGKQDEAGISMRGGRWIGPLERILILLLASVEAPAAVAAIVAAKGVIRFPEISKDEAGQKAEEFLIGSFASWILAVLGAVVIHVS